MTRYAFTGPTGPFQIPGPVVEYVASVTRDLPDPELFISGCAHGIDTIAMMNSWLQHTGAHQHLFVPGNGDLWHNNSLVRAVEAGEYGQGFTVTRVRGNYMDRNDAMIDALTSDGVLLAFPETPEEEIRSGTWATVRRARKIGAGVLLFPLDEVLR